MYKYNNLHEIQAINPPKRGRDAIKSEGLTLKQYDVYTAFRISQIVIACPKLVSLSHRVKIKL